MTIPTSEFHDIPHNLKRGVSRWYWGSADLISTYLPQIDMIRLLIIKNITACK